MSVVEVVEQAEIEWDLVDRLHKSLRLAGLKPGQMADHLEVHRNTVGGWLRGRRMDKPALLAWAVKCSETSPVPITFEWLTENLASSFDLGLSSPADQQVLLDDTDKPLDFAYPRLLPVGVADLMARRAS